MTTRQIFRTVEGAAHLHRAYRLLIETHLPFADQQTVTTSVGATFVLSAGPLNAPPVLLLPGSGSVAASYALELRELSRTHRAHAIDLPGESGLSAPSRLPLHKKAHADWLHEVAEALRAAPASMVGTSLGGWVALDYATTYPDAVDELVLLSPSGIGPRRIGPLLVAALLSTLGDKGRRHALKHLLGPAAPEYSDAFHRDLGELALATFRHFRPRTDQIPVFTDDDIRSLPTNLTVILGERDRMLRGDRAAERLQRLDLQSRTRLLPGRGHLAPQEAYLRHLRQRSAPTHPTAIAEAHRDERPRLE